MDSQRFDDLTKTLASAGTRRNALRTGAALGAGLVGVRVLGASADDTIAPEGNKCQGKSCNKNKNCGKGLQCSNKGKCEYKNGNKGSKGDTCCGNNDCKSGLKCKNNKCKNK